MREVRSNGTVTHFGGQTCVALAQKFRHFRADVSQGAQIHALTLMEMMTTPQFQTPTIAVVGVVRAVEAGYCNNAIE